MSGTCVFCGSAATMTGEHVFGDWLTRIGLALDPAAHEAGPLNRIGRDLGVRPPFRQKVRDVCGDCNHGWMSRLEGVAQRTLTPFILGDAGELDADVLGAVASWAHKTALTSMLVSSDAERADGYGLPADEYHSLFALREAVTPPPSQFWMGRHTGSRFASARVTPIAIRIDGIIEPDQPQGYVMTIALGQLLVQGIRFTAPLLDVPVTNELGLPQIWPPAGNVSWPDGTAVDDTMFIDVTAAKTLRSADPPIQIRPWTPATELPASQLVENMVKLPTICGKHAAYYPASLVIEARHGRFFAFATACECPRAYLVHTEPDGAHCRATGTAEYIANLYDELPGEEHEIHDEGGVFFCKRLLTDSAH